MCYDFLLSLRGKIRNQYQRGQKNLLNDKQKMAKTTFGYCVYGGPFLLLLLVCLCAKVSASEIIRFIFGLPVALDLEKLLPKFMAMHNRHGKQQPIENTYTRRCGCAGIRGVRVVCVCARPLEKQKKCWHCHKNGKEMWEMRTTTDGRRKRRNYYYLFPSFIRFRKEVLGAHKFYLCKHTARLWWYYLENILI